MNFFSKISSHQILVLFNFCSEFWRKSS